MGRLEGYKALIVGGGRGLGRASALVFAKDGADVVVAARTKSDIDEVAVEVEKLGRTSGAIQCDATVSSQVDSIVEKAVNILGKIDILVNTQGDWLIKPTLETTEEMWDHIMDTNLKSVHLVCKAVIPHMVKEESGHIFNISSASGLWYPGGGIITAYKAPKLGLIGFSKALASEFQTKGIGVHSIAPESMDTPMRWEATPRVYKERLLKPETVADLMVTISSHKDLNIDEVIVPRIPLPYTVPYMPREKRRQ